MNERKEDEAGSRNPVSGGMAASVGMLDGLVARGREAARGGKVADYIPALARIDGRQVGAAIVDAGGRILESGDSRAAFTLQSVSKAMALPYVIDTIGEEAVFSRVGREPTGDPFNSIIRLEASSLRKPYNPMINAGAIVVTSLMPGRTGAEKVEGFRAWAAPLLGLDELAEDTEVSSSEAETANRNRSIAWFLKELGLLDSPVDVTLDAYFHQCATLVDAASLARFAAILAFDGIETASGRRMMTPRAARVTKALMMSCGLYDGSGSFCVEAGIPAKSGVGGGIAAAAKGRYGIATYGPALDAHGNSLAGTLIIRGLSEALDLFEI
jgi:glutaminase